MRKLGATFILVMLAIALSGLKVSARQPNNWFGANPDIAVAEVSRDGLGDLDTYNAPCQDSSFWHYNINGWNIVSSEERTACVHRASYGDISLLGGVRLTNTDTALQIRDATNVPYEQFFPIPGSNHIYTTGSGAGLGRESFYIYKDFPDRFTVVKHPDTKQPIHYKLNSMAVAPENRVKYQNGNIASMDPVSLGYADNGKYMLGNYHQYQVLMNTETLQARKFGFTTPAYSGSRPKVNTALNKNATLALINVSDGPVSKIFNLANCSGAQDGSVVESCQSLDLFPLVKAKIPNIKNITRSEFLADNTLYIRANVDMGVSMAEKWYRITPGSGGVSMRYLALGDSFASGEGAHNYRSGTDQTGNKCHTSLDSYGYLIKSQINLPLAETIACSGAVMKDISPKSQPDYAKDKPQATGLTGIEHDEPIYDGFLPGYRRQIDFIERYQPESITLSIGGNDIGFANKLTWCVLSPQSCYALHSSRAGILREIKNQFEGLTKTYGALRTASPETRIYVVGYPNIAKPGGPCARNVRLTNEEIELSEAMVADLNYVIKKAAEKTGVIYVDAENAFTGHRMCETSSSNVAVNGLTLGNDMASIFGLSLLGKESYHPNKLGHRLYKDAILPQTNNLTKAMPKPNWSANLNSMPSRLVNDPSTLNVPLPLEFMEEGEAWVKRGANLILDTVVNTWLEPGTNYRVEIHSNPTDIGSATAKDKQTLEINAQIPQSTELGPHTLHIIGKNIAGEEIDLYKNIVVIQDESDVDGDSISNEEDTCPFLEPGTSLIPEEAGFCVTLQSENSETPSQPESGTGGEDAEDTSSTNLLQPSAPSSENNSLTPPLGAPPLNLIGNISRYLGALSTPVSELFASNNNRSKDSKNDKEQSKTTSLKTSANQGSQSRKKFFLTLGASSSLGAALFFRVRRSR